MTSKTYTELAEDWLELYCDLRCVTGMMNPELELLKIMLTAVSSIHEEVLKLYHEKGFRR